MSVEKTRAMGRERGRGCRDIPLGADGPRGPRGPGCTISVISFFRSVPITEEAGDLHKRSGSQDCSIVRPRFGSNEGSFLGDGCLWDT